MKHVFVMAFAFVFFFVTASAAQAQQLRGPGQVTTAPARVFSRAAIDRAVAATLPPAPALTPAFALAPTTPVPHAKKPFFKTPWPYLIAGGVAVALIAVYAGNNSSSNGSGY